MTNATTAANGAAGLVPAPTAAQYNYFLTGHGWATNVGTAAYANNAAKAFGMNTLSFTVSGSTLTITKT